MSQHDMNIANQGFPAFRADLNDALGALVSNSSGATAPSTTFAHQLWVDTAANPSVLKIRNADNDAWITIGEIDQTGDKFNLKCANATILENLTLNAQGDLRFADSDSSHYVAFQAPATVSSNVTWTLPATDGTSGQALTTDGSGTLSWAAGSPEGSYSFRNRIINGDMRIDQRNAGASVTATTTGTQTYTLDRWGYLVAQASKLTVEQTVSGTAAPAGFVDYLGVTSSSAYSVLTGDYFYISQFIEGTNTADLGWGTANAKTVTLSFWVRSSLTGTFGGTIRNSSVDRTYPFTYTISSSNTWEYKTVTIPGDTSGTWLTTTGIGIRVGFSVGAGASQSGTAGAWAAANYSSATGAVSVVGTNAATWYITGVQLEVGSVATPFERRPYGTELSLCQRYYQLVDNGWGKAVSTTEIQFNASFVVEMRATPSLSGTTLRCTDNTVADFQNASATFSAGNTNVRGGRYISGSWTGLTSGTMYQLLGTGTNAAPVRYSAEL